MAKGWLDWGTLASDYARYHTQPKNRLCHAVGIPLIMLCVVRWTTVAGFPWAMIVLPLYVRWDVALGLAMAGVVFAMAAACAVLPAFVFPVFFVLGWAFQLVGHKLYEKKSPAFTQNLLHVLVGPMWVLGELFAPAVDGKIRR